MPLAVISNSDVGNNAGCARADGGNSHTDLCGGFAIVKVDVFTVGVDCFAGVDCEPVAVAVEATLKCQLEVGAAGYGHGKGVAGGMGGDFHPLVYSG